MTELVNYRACQICNLSFITKSFGYSTLLKYAIEDYKHCLGRRSSNFSVDHDGARSSRIPPHACIFLTNFHVSWKLSLNTPRFNLQRFAFYFFSFLFKCLNFLTHVFITEKTISSYICWWANGGQMHMLLGLRSGKMSFQKNPSSLILLSSVTIT